MQSANGWSWRAFLIVYFSTCLWQNPQALGLWDVRGGVRRHVTVAVQTHNLPPTAPGLGTYAAPTLPHSTFHVQVEKKGGRECLAGQFSNTWAWWLCTPRCPGLRVEISSDQGRLRAPSWAWECGLLGCHGSDVPSCRRGVSWEV